jgi:hypothetical protein
MGACVPKGSPIQVITNTVAQLPLLGSKGVVGGGGISIGRRKIVKGIRKKILVYRGTEMCLKGGSESHSGDDVPVSRYRVDFCGMGRPIFVPSSSLLKFVVDLPGRA